MLFPGPTTVKRPLDTSVSRGLLAGVQDVYNDLGAEVSTIARPPIPSSSSKSLSVSHPEPGSLSSANEDVTGCRRPVMTV